jgi:hypothetical protein
LVLSGTVMNVCALGEGIRSGVKTIQYHWRYWEDRVRDLGEIAVRLELDGACPEFDSSTRQQYLRRRRLSLGINPVSGLHMTFSGAVHGPYKDKLVTALPIMSSVAPADGNTSIAQQAKIVLKWQIHIVLAPRR